MPKVKEGYFEDKKNAILDAAQKICQDMPLNKMTMTDIINETGLSPGSVYATFSNIYEVIIALVNRPCIIMDITGDVDSILREHDKPEKKIAALLSYQLRLIASSIGTHALSLTFTNYTCHIL